MPRPSKKSARQARILALMDSNPLLRATDLSSTLSVSSETIRRDLSELEASGRITRTHGGAVRSQGFEPALAERLTLMVPERQRIAREAVQMVSEVGSLFIGGGASTLHFARALRVIDRRMQVITASFSIAQELSANPLLQVMALPGCVEPKEGLVHGPETLAAIRTYRPEMAVIGASGVCVAGVSEALLAAAQVYAAMIGHSAETLILADHSKFGKHALQVITGWQPLRTLVTDAMPDEALCSAIKDAGAKVVVARND